MARNKGGFEPKPMNVNRFKGTSSTNVTTQRHFDQGGVRDYVGAPIAPAKGNLKNQTQAAARVTQAGVSHPGSTGLGGTSGIAVGYPKTGGPKLRHKNGMGPKVTNTSTRYQVQKGKTSGPDKTPKGLKGVGTSTYQKGGALPVGPGRRGRR